MPSAYLLSDRAIQIDWASPIAATEKSLQATELAMIRHKLIQSPQTLNWPAWQCVQADQSMTVIFEHPIIANGRYKALLDQLTHFLTEVDKTKWPADNPGRHHQITVNYGGVVGQDLEWLAQQTGLSVAEVIDLHCSAIYTVQFLGFLPGFAYLTGLPKQLHFSRRETPRSRVPAGTLAIAAHYCAVYPWESPGGWHLMGHVEQLLFDPERNPQEGPSIFNAGDTVQFVRADHA
jgi:KipI family sensor histidine kinase inhibitor